VKKTATQTEALRLEHIVPYIDQASKKQADKVAEVVLSLAGDYMQWRRERQRGGIERFLSDYLDTSTFSTFLSVATYVYRKEISSEATSTSRKRHQELPVITVLRQGLKLCNKNSLKQS
jgi:hypothetical protein